MEICETQETKFTRQEKMIITEWITLITVFVGCFFFLYAEMKSIRTEIHDRVLAQEKRTDRLYEMFIDLVKENRKT